MIRNEKFAYVVQKRKYGEGELRLGKAIVMKSSIYDYAFILQI